MKKKVLLIGSGGREHAIAWKLKQSPDLGQLFVAPGNGGTELLATNVPIKATDIIGLLQFALKEKIDLTIVGPDDPLSMGIVDVFQAESLRIFGPTAKAAQIESSKVYAKRLMRRCNVPTASFEVYTEYAKALEHVQLHFSLSSLPIVIKASGLALGKGVYVCYERPEALLALDEIMIKRVHDAAGDQVVIENYVSGREVSLHALSDGKSCCLFPPAQDHKPVFDGDNGPNTGGMGTIAPVPWFLRDYIEVSKSVISPILNGLEEDRHPFVGCLYPGIKMFAGQSSVLEYNARFGDPETQVYMRLLKSDLLGLFEACVDGCLLETNTQWYQGFAACIVLASAGYPSPDYRKGLPITGISEAEKLPEVIVFHAGTKRVDDQFFTSGGRVLGVSATGSTLEQALDRAYAGVDCIKFDGKHYRKDIGAKSLQ